LGTESGQRDGGRGTRQENDGVNMIKVCYVNITMKPFI
jgi:hypothetical protein